MRWREIPVEARRYILYHTMVSPLLISWHMLPVYMFMTGYSVLEVGLLFTVVSVASIPATYLVGRFFERCAVRHGLVAIDLLEAAAYFAYGLAYGPVAPVALFTGLILEEVSGVLYPLYQVAERLLYPQDRVEEVLTWHMRLPVLSQLAGFLSLGYIFGHVLTSPRHYRVGFMVLGASSVGAAAYLIRALPKMSGGRRLTEELEFRFDREFALILAVESLTTAAWELAPGIVLLNYVINVLGLTLFEAMVVEAMVSLGALAATYIAEKVPREQRFLAISIGYALISAWALVMALSPPFTLVLVAYFTLELGSTLMFPFYRGWLFTKIPEGKASSILASISSYRRLISLFTPGAAGYLAYLSPTLPYLTSLIMFTVAAALFMAIHLWKRTPS